MGQETLENTCVASDFVSPGIIQVQAAISRRWNPAKPITARTATVPTATTTADTDRPWTNGIMPGVLVERRERLERFEPRNLRPKTFTM